MDPFQVRQALSEVRHLRRNILEKQLFKGYSGRARALGGGVALVAGLAGQAFLTGRGPAPLFVLWGVVFALSVLANYGAVVVWLLQEANRKRGEVGFIMEVFPAWVVGGVLTLALWSHGEPDLLFGTWMCLFGLVQSIGRSRLPRQMAWIGLYYVVCGSLCLVFADGIFQWPVLMGSVFFCGELGAGLIMHTADREGGLARYLGWGKGS